MSGLAGYLAGENDGPGGAAMPKRQRRPCSKCGGPKPPGRGLRLCDACERAPRRPAHVPTPCGACGSRENKQPNKQLCDECRTLRGWRRKTREKARNLVLRQPCARCGSKKSPGKGRKFCDACHDADHQAPRCPRCKTRPVRGHRKRLCVECHEASRARAREAEARRTRERTRAGLTQPIKRAAYERLRHDPEKWAYALETQRLRYRLKAAREGRVVKPREPRNEGLFDLPARPLALVFWELAKRSDLGTVCEVASVVPRDVSRWMTGSLPTISSAKADEILTALDLLWWEVWREDTVRRPLFVVHEYSHQMKSRDGGPPVLRRVKQHRRPYGDQGPDREKLAEIAARMSGEAMAA